MLAIKWKNNKRKSVAAALGVSVLITVVFFCFLPTLERRANKNYDNPLTSEEFVSVLYDTNYVQYKYLRDRVDQKNWSYEDLYVSSEYLGTYNDENYIYNDQTSLSISEYAIQNSEELSYALERYKAESLPELESMKAKASLICQLVDYYAVDKESGISISNSDEEALRAILEGEAPVDHPYVYYVYMNYDSVGNLANCGVYTDDSPGEFLKLVEAKGYESHCWNHFDEYGEAFIHLRNSYREERYRYRMSVGKPSGMKIIYAMTPEQYEVFIKGGDNNLISYGGTDMYMLYDVISSYSDSWTYSYRKAGATGIILAFLIAAMLSGAVMNIFLKRGENSWYHYDRLTVGRLSMELNLFLMFLLLCFSGSMTELVCSWQKGWFLQNSLLLSGPSHLTDLIVFLIFLGIFMAAFTLGNYLPRLSKPGQCFKESSFLYRYWDKIVQYLKSFYRELLNYDIGTEANRTITKLVIINGVILCVISCFWVFGVVFLVIYSLVIYLLLKKYVKDVQSKYRNLLRATGSIARGDFDNALSEDFGVFESYKTELRQIQRDFKHAVEEEVKSQRMKSELITNVSHDLKTPLTAIITYINLLKESDITPGQRAEYLDTLDRKAVRLKVLIEDLFEVSKASTNNVTINYAQVDIASLLRQCYLEYEDRFAEQNLLVKFTLPEEKIILQLDPQKTFRIFENLYTNIIKYAMPSTRVYVVMKKLTDCVEIQLKNISNNELQIAPEELTERFVRGDGSRNTEGSGLGLAIARSFAELQHGTMRLDVDGDLFKVTLIFPRQAVKDEEAKTDSQDGNASGSDAVPHSNCAEVDERFHPRRWRSEKNLNKGRRR